MATKMTPGKWNSSDLPWMLSEVPLRDRAAAAAAGVISADDLVVYHVTSAGNVEAIRKVGITAKSSQQSYDRPDAVYFFVLRNEINESTLAILGINDPVVLTVTVPAAEVIAKMRWDGLYNVSFETVSAVQFMGDVPADWIE